MLRLISLSTIVKLHQPLFVLPRGEEFDILERSSILEESDSVADQDGDDRDDKLIDQVIPQQLRKQLRSAIAIDSFAGLAFQLIYQFNQVP